MHGIGDKGSLYEFLDWMLSPSSNSAAGMVMREAMLLRQFGKAYPLPEDKIRSFFRGDAEERADGALRSGRSSSA